MAQITKITAECPNCGSMKAHRIDGSSDLLCDDCNATFAQTYTIAFTPEMLIAIVPDGQDIKAAVAAYEQDAGEAFTDYDIEDGLTLTNDRPDDSSSIVFISKNGSCGFLTASDGKTYDYAIRYFA